uniref:Uncharacterized protein n=1 Tax=Oryza sativa subsp. japonica TaxID=39947 RepID=Q6EP36_ORYSJ|nr:unknown protein [Oryza sativa Japonica Group]BAD29584.1 unknown protein [Oryza sativa Japonica Group]
MISVVYICTHVSIFFYLLPSLLDTWIRTYVADWVFAMQVPGQGGHHGGGPGSVAGEDEPDIGGAGGDGDGGGGGEDGGEAAAHLVDLHPLLDGVLPDDHLLRRAGHPHGPPPPPGRRPRRVRHPGGLPLRLPLPLHPPLHLPQRARPRAGGPPPHPPPPGPHLAPARRRGPRPRHRRHGHLRARREEAARRRQRRRRRRHDQRVLAGAAVLPGGRRRGVRVRRAAGVLHPRGAGADEVDEHGALPGDAVHGILPQQLPRLRRRRRHAGGVDTERPRRRQAGPLLLDAGRARGGQLRRVPRVREAPRVQAARRHGRRGGGARRCQGRRRRRGEGDGRLRRGQGGRRRDGCVDV